MAVQVSVVVAVYNPGDLLVAAVESVRRQTIGTDALELVLVDDGSTDGTGEHLLDLAAAEAWVRTTRIENSGWPSRPRNVGLGLATGEYVLFLDQDDELYPAGLEHLLASARAHGSDIVVGKEVRSGARTMGLETFRRNKGEAHLFTDRVMDVPTPHKLFRRAFLDQHGVRFPEDLRRLEDHHLLADCHGHRPRVSIVADEPCYRWVIHTDNNSVRLPDPHDYYGALDAVLDVVEAWPLADDEKRRARQFWFKANVLDRFGPGGFRTWPEEFRPRFFAEALRVTRERFEEGLEDGMPPAHRVRAALLRAGDMEGLVRYSTAEAAVTTRPTLESTAVVEGSLLLTVRTLLEGADGQVRFEADGATVRQQPSAPVPPDVAALLEVSGDLDEARVDVVLVERSTNAEWFLPTTATTALVPEGDHCALAVEAQATLDPATALLGAPLTQGIWDLRLRVDALGYDSRPTIRTGTVELPGPLAFPGLRVEPYVTKNGRLALRAGTAQAASGARLGVEPSAAVRPSARPLHRRALGAARRRLGRPRSRGDQVS
jgi:glycosyltransferase involved in cell wall biosynthesis